jgi:hypothetical protein
MINLNTAYIVALVDTSSLETEQLPVRILSLFPSASRIPPRFGGKSNLGLGSGKYSHQGGKLKKETSINIFSLLSLVRLDYYLTILVQNCTTVFWVCGLS